MSSAKSGIKSHSVWAPESDRDLLLAVIAVNDVKGIKWPDISSKLASMGYTFTHEACRQHFQKLRQKATPSSTPTPSKRTSNGTPKSSTTSNRKSKSTKSTAAKEALLTTNGHFNEDDDGLPETDCKKAKKEEDDEDDSGQSATQFKVEDMENRGFVDLENDDLYEA